MKPVCFILVLLILSCCNRNCLSPQVDKEIAVERLQDTIIIMNAEVSDTFVMGRDSMFYDAEGALAFSTKKDTVLYKSTGIGGSHCVKVIRKVDNDLFKTSWYLYFASKELRLRMQIQYNSKFEIRGVKLHKSTDYIL